jgi:hypothetical protein
LRSAAILLPDDDGPEFQRLQRDLFQTYRPRTRDEAECVESMAAHQWRMARCRRWQAAFDAQTEALHTGMPNALPGHICEQDPHRWMHKSMDCVLQESRLDRLQCRARDKLLLLQKLRRNNLIAGAREDGANWPVSMAAAPGQWDEGHAFRPTHPEAVLEMDGCVPVRAPVFPPAGFPPAGPADAAAPNGGTQPRWPAAEDRAPAHATPSSIDAIEEKNERALHPPAPGAAAPGGARAKPELTQWGRPTGPLRPPSSALPGNRAGPHGERARRVEHPREDPHDPVAPSVPVPPDHTRADTRPSAPRAMPQAILEPGLPVNSGFLPSGNTAGISKASP